MYCSNKLAYYKYSKTIRNVWKSIETSGGLSVLWPITFLWGSALLNPLQSGPKCTPRDLGLSIYVDAKQQLRTSQRDDPLPTYLIRSFSIIHCETLTAAYHKVQRLKELYEKALDDIQSKDDQTEVSRCLLEETMESAQCQEKAVNKAGEVPGSGSKGCHAQAGNPGLGHEKTGTQWMPKVWSERTQSTFGGPLGGTDQTRQVEH